MTETINTNKRARRFIAFLLTLLLFAGLAARPLPALAAETVQAGAPATEMMFRVKISPDVSGLPAETKAALEALGLRVRVAPLEGSERAASFVADIDVIREETDVLNINVLRDEETYVQLPQLLDDVLKIDLSKLLSLSGDALTPLSAPLSSIDLPGLATLADNVRLVFDERLSEAEPGGTTTVSTGGIERTYEVEIRSLSGEPLREAMLAAADTLGQSQALEQLFMGLLRPYLDKNAEEHRDKPFADYIQDLKNFIGNVESFETISMFADSYYEGQTLRGGAVRFLDESTGDKAYYRAYDIVDGDTTHTTHLFSMPDAMNGRLDFSLTRTVADDESLTGPFYIFFGQGQDMKEVASGSVANLRMIPSRPGGPHLALGRLELVVSLDEENKLQINISSEQVENRLEAELEVVGIGSLLMTMQEIDPALIEAFDPAAFVVVPIESKEQIDAIADEQFMSKLKDILKTFGFPQLNPQPTA